MKNSIKEWIKAKPNTLFYIKVFGFVFALGFLFWGALKLVPEEILPVSSTNQRELPIYCVSCDEPKIALTFDAAWGNEDTGEILGILEKQDVKVTFFMTGGWVDTYPEDVMRIYAAGHDLGNHSQNHKNMSQLSEAEIKEELRLVHDSVKELTGYEMFLFRPPYGDYDNELIRTAREMNYFTVQWDVDGRVSRII